MDTKPLRPYDSETRRYKRLYARISTNQHELMTGAYNVVAEDQGFKSPRVLSTEAMSLENSDRSINGDICQHVMDVCSCRSKSSECLNDLA